nr:hypothetical protein [uncultured Flavobacterium sp.]
MNKLSVLLLLAFISCKNLEIKKENTLKLPFQDLITDNYELIKPNKNIKSVVVLFGGFPEKPEDIKREFNILQLAKENNIAIVYMNYNKKLWLEENEKQKLAAQLQSIFLENKLPKNSLYIGGFSSGGNVSLLIGSFLKENEKFALDPKGIFSIDSPIDLVALYKSSEKNLKQNSSETSLQESTWIIETLEKQFGNPNNTISKYETYSVFTSTTNNIDNLKSLKNTKIRLYSEPDTLWWKENRKADYDQMNAFYIKKLYERLKESGFKQVENITTKNKGYRSNGERHPHSWSIVDKNDLIQWIIQ